VITSYWAIWNDEVGAVQPGGGISAGWLALDVDAQAGVRFIIITSSSSIKE
jgi:hypothetical protein